MEYKVDEEVIKGEVYFGDIVDFLINENVVVFLENKIDSKVFNENDIEFVVVRKEVK